MAKYLDKVVQEVDKIASSIEIFYASGNKEYPKLYSSINENIRCTYNLFNLSAISGEYVEDSSDFENLILKISSYIGNKIITNISDEKTIKEDDLSETLYSLVNTLCNDLKTYKFEVHHFNLSLSNPQLSIIDSDPINENDFSTEIPNLANLNQLSEIFFYNLFLVRIDRSFNLDNRIFYNLNKLKHRLSRYNSSSKYGYIEALIHKCDILLFKFNYKENIEYLNQAYNYYDGKEEKITMVSNGDISDRTKSIYTKDIREYIKNITTFYKETARKSEFNFIDFYIKCHYFKNISKNQNLLHDLIDDFKLERSKIKNNFDKKNADICLNFFANCYLSFLLKQNVDLTTVWTEKFKIETIQDITCIKNYFPFLKLAEWYKNYLYKNVDGSDNLTTLNNCLQHLKTNLDVAEKYLLDSEHTVNCFVPFKPNYENCFEEYPDKNGDKIKIFISTSFIIPIDKEKEKKRINDLHLEYIRLRAILESKIQLDKALSKISKSNQEVTTKLSTIEISVNHKFEKNSERLNQELKENQKNSIQILAIFSGIVTFASGTIQIFKGASNIKDATIFMILFATSLCLVAVTTWLLFTPKDKRDWDISKYLFIGIMVCILICSLYAIFSDWGNNPINTVLLMEKNFLYQ